MVVVELILMLDHRVVDTMWEVVAWVLQVVNRHRGQNQLLKKHLHLKSLARRNS
jgi:hypothetical protein